MFDSHPEMAVPPESHCLVRFGRNRERYERVGSFDAELFIEDVYKLWSRKWGLPADELTLAFSSASPATVPEAIRTMFSAYAGRQGKRRYAEKTPVNVMHIPLLAELLPESRFIHIIRDGRDVTLSYLSVDFGTETLGEGAIYWKRAVEQGRRDGSQLGPARYREIKYEDLVQDPEGTLRDLCGFVDLPFDPLMLRYFERAQALQTSIHATAHRNLSRPPERTREWRDEMRPQDVAVFEALAGSTLERFGYARAVPAVPAAARLRAGTAIAALNARRLRRASAKPWLRFTKKRKRKANR